MEDSIDKSLELALKKAREFRAKEQEEYMNSFITERNKVFSYTNDIKKPKKLLTKQHIIISLTDDEEEDKKTVVEAVKPVEEAEKPITKEPKPHKLISVKPAPYDLKPSNRDVKIEELEDKIADMQNKYNVLMKKFKSQKEELNECIKYREYYDKMHSVKTTVKQFIKDNYEITSLKTDRIKCSELYDEYCKINKSISNIEFIKQVQLEGVFKSKLDGKNYFKCIKPLT